MPRITILAFALAVGIIFLVHGFNAHIEARCQAAGGQVLQVPDDFSRCLLPPAR